MARCAPATWRPTGLTVIVGEEVRTADGDLIGLYLERAVPPGLSAAETAAAIHEQGGLVGLPASVRPVPLLGAGGPAGGAAAPSWPRAVDYVEILNARGLSAAPTRAAPRSPRRTGCPGVASSDAHTRDGARRGLHRPGRPDHRPPRSCVRAARGRDADHGPCLVPRARPGRPSPRSSSGCAATSVCGPARSVAGRRRPTASRSATRRLGRRRGHAAAGDDRGRGHRRRRDVCARTRPRAARSRAEQISLTAPPARPADDRLDRPAHHRPAAPHLSRPAGLPARPAASDLILDANPWWLLAAFGIYYLGFPLRGYRWALLLRGTGYPLRRQGLDRDHLHQLAGQLRRAGQAGRCLPRLPAARQLRRRRSARPSAPSSSSASSTSSRSSSWAWRPASGASATACRRAVQIIFAIGLVVVIVLAVGLFVVRNFGRRHPRPAAGAAPHRRVLRPLRGGLFSVDRRQLPGSAIADRAHLDDRGAAAAASSSRRSASTISTWASAARSSWRSSPRC